MYTAPGHFLYAWAPSVKTQEKFMRSDNNL
jgi:hypothetical protein